MRTILAISGAAAAALTAGLFSAPVSAGGPPACQGLTGKARTDCLYEEKRRGERELRAIEARNRELDDRKAVWWVATRSSVIVGAAAAPVDRALKNPHPCTKRAR